MPSTTTGSVAAGSTTPVVANPGAQANNEDNVAILEMSGTYGTVTGTWQASATGESGTYANIAAVRMDTLAIEQTPTITDNTTRQWKADITGMPYVQFLPTLVTTGTIAIAINTAVGTIPNPLLQSALSGNQAISGTMTVTSTSATALTVGPNGSTNPGFTVDGSGATAATGISIKGAAAASSVAIAVTSSGTNEGLTVNAKGTGTVKINSLAGTGAVQIGGAASGANATGITITPAAAASGVAVAVVSSGTNENITLDAKGSGTITIGSVSTGAVIISGNAKTVIAGTLTAGGLTTCALQIATSGPAIYSGSGAPSISAAVKGSLYLRSDGSSSSTRMYVASDAAGTWVAVTTAS